MNVYADEKFYKEAYLCRNIDFENIPQAVKMCCCELAENLFSENKSLSENAGIQSESVGGWSRNYTSKSEILTHFKSEQKRIIYKWLADTGLLYRGVK